MPTALIDLGSSLTGRDVYIVASNDNGESWTGSVWQIYTTNRAAFALPLDEIGVTGRYGPFSLPDEVTSWVFYLQAGVSPDDSDVRVGSDGVVTTASGSGGSSLVLSVDNTEIVAARVRKVGTRADGVAVAYPPIQPKAGDELPWWINLVDFMGGRHIDYIDNVQTSDAAAVAIMVDGDTQLTGVFSTHGVLWLDGLWSGEATTATITFDAHIGRQKMTVEVPALKPTN